MIKPAKLKTLTLSTLITAFVFAVVFSCAVNGQADPFSEIREKLSGISSEEKEKLQKLFTLTQEIEALEIEEKKLAVEIQAIKEETANLEKAIEKGELDCQKKKESLRQVLKSYQRMGPGSFIEIVLDSENFGEFLHRLNTIRDLTRNTGELLDQLEASGRMLAEERTRLLEKSGLLEEKQKQSKEALAEKLELKEEQEEFLASLEGEREYYSQYLASIEQVWGEIKLLFSDVVKNFSRIAEEGNIPADAVKISISFPDIKGSIEDDTINGIISEHSGLPPMELAFRNGKAEINLPDKYLKLSGIFTVKDGYAIEFQAEEGSFYGMPLEPAAIGELFGGALLLDLKPLLGGYEIHAVELKEGYLELLHKLSLF